ncbi:MAG: hypothetical protein HON65_15440 [Rhodospirillales bacterium]|jgi:hypothetical protein|nr:hypothetical protein [Rhodospirillales bacterium]
MKTLIIQSYRTSNVADWIEMCQTSVKHWSEIQGYEYRFVGDEIFERVPNWYLDKTRSYPQIATDLGRLELINEALEEGYNRVAWIDADVLIFNPEPFTINLTDGFALGRELWIQKASSGGLKLYRNVHNAFCVFCPDNAFLNFYRYACKQVLSQMEAEPGKGLLPQIVGPKLLSTLHNILDFDLLDDIAMVSPVILHDLASDTSAGLTMLKDAATAPINGANLCASLEQDNPQDMLGICERLMEAKTLF